MKKTCLQIIILFLLIMFIQIPAKADDIDDWAKATEVYDSDGLDKPVSAVEYQKVMKQLQEMKDRKNRKSWWAKWRSDPTPKTPNEPIKVERNDILKITTPLYYDGVNVPVGFYKITCSKENEQYYINLLQGKTPIVKVLANKIPHSSFAPDKINMIQTEVYKEDYFKISFKTIDYAVSAYLTIMK